MIEVNALLFTLLTEAVALLSIILIIMLFLMIKRKNRDRAAAKKLVGHIKSTAEHRLEVIKTHLKNSKGLDADELHSESKKIDRKEKDFFSQIVRLYVKKEAALLQNLDESLDSLLNEYRNLNDVAENSATDGSDLSQQVEQLIQEKQKLELELSITKHTMSGMMSEFNNMFNGGNGGGEAEQTKQIQQALTDAEGEPTAPRSISELNDLDDDIAFETEAEKAISQETAVEEINETATEQKSDSQNVADDDLVNKQQQSSDQSDIDDIFGDIVNADDVDDLLDGIDLSEDIETK